LVEFSENNEISKLYQNEELNKLSQRYICSQHFEVLKYNNPMKRIKLCFNAIPTLIQNSIPSTSITISCNKTNSVNLESNNNSVEGIIHSNITIIRNSNLNYYHFAAFFTACSNTRILKIFIPSKSTAVMLEHNCTPSQETQIIAPLFRETYIRALKCFNE